MREVYGYYGTYYVNGDKNYINCQAPYCETLVEVPQIVINFGWQDIMCIPCNKFFVECNF